jgi:hypothetical protein
MWYKHRNSQAEPLLQNKLAGCQEDNDAPSQFHDWFAADTRTETASPYQRLNLRPCFSCRRRSCYKCGFECVDSHRRGCSCCFKRKVLLRPWCEECADELRQHQGEDGVPQLDEGVICRALLTVLSIPVLVAK